MPAGDLFRGDFHTKIATGNHNSVDERENIFEPFQRCGLFDLGHYASAIANDIACFKNILRPLDK